MRYQINKGLGASDPCAENFWSAACWFGSGNYAGSAESLGLENRAAGINVTPPPVSNCAGTLAPDGSCKPVVQPNDPNNSTGALTASGGNFQDTYNTWAGSIQESANVPQSNTTGILWIAALLAGAIFLMKR